MDSGGSSSSYKNFRRQQPLTTDELIFTPGFYRPPSNGRQQQQQQTQPHSPILAKHYYQETESFDDPINIQSYNNRPGILLDGENRLSKYKNNNNFNERLSSTGQRELPIKYIQSEEELNNLLASIQNTNPLLNNLYDEDFDNNYNRFQNLLNRNGKINNLNNPALQLSASNQQHLPKQYIKSNNDRNINDDNTLVAKQSSFNHNHENRQPIYSEENMKYSNDDNEEVIKKDHSNQQHQSGDDHKKGENNEFALNGYRFHRVPSSIMDSKHLIRTPKAYQRISMENDHKESRIAHLSDIYFIG